jgi:hypothetical protein
VGNTLPIELAVWAAAGPSCRLCASSPRAAGVVSGASVTVTAATGAASGVGGVKVGCGLWVAAVAGVATAVSSLGWVLLIPHELGVRGEEVK